MSSPNQNSAGSSSRSGLPSPFSPAPSPSRQEQRAKRLLDDAADRLQRARAIESRNAADRAQLDADRAAFVAFQASSDHDKNLLLEAKVMENVAKRKLMSGFVYSIFFALFIAALVLMLASPGLPKTCATYRGQFGMSYTSILGATLGTYAAKAALEKHLKRTYREAADGDVHAMWCFFYHMAPVCVAVGAGLIGILWGFLCTKKWEEKDKAFLANLLGW